MNQPVRHALLGLCMSATTIATAPAHASTASYDLPSRTVSYADLDLTKPAGAKTLYRRISAAAQQVCVPSMHGEYFDLGWRAKQQACIDKAIGAAVQHVNAVALNDQLAKAATQVARN